MRIRRGGRTSYHQRRRPRGPGLVRLAVLTIAVATIFLLVDRCPTAPAGAETKEASPKESSASGSLTGESMARTRTEATGGGPLATATATANEGPQNAVVAAAPGTVVRWPGDGIEECRLGDDAFPPIDDACYFPIDLGAENALRAERDRNAETERLRIEIADYVYPEQRIELEDTSRVHLSPENQARAGRERERIDAVWQTTDSRRFRLPLGPPLEKPGEARRFGARRVFNGQPRSPHSGADYRASRGTPVLAADDARVALAEEHFFGGRSVFLDHGDQLVTMYFHLDEIFVEAGEIVTRGAVLGTVGSTGRATGPHLHFGVRWRGARIDPSALLGDSSALVVAD